MAAAMAGRRGEEGVMVFTGLEGTWEVAKSGRWLAGGCRTVWVHLLPLNRALENRQVAGVCRVHFITVKTVSGAHREGQEGREHQTLCECR